MSSNYIQTFTNPFKALLCECYVFCDISKKSPNETQKKVFLLSLMQNVSYYTSNVAVLFLFTLYKNLCLWHVWKFDVVCIIPEMYGSKKQAICVQAFLTRIWPHSIILFLFLRTFQNPLGFCKTYIKTGF